MGNQTASVFSSPVAQPFFMRGDQHGILLVHGFTGSAAHMRKIGVELHDQGFTVKGINLPGHAQSIREMARTGRDDWLKAVRSALLSLRDECKTVTCCGLSMGGVLSLIMAENGLVDAVCTISAPMAVQNRMMPFARFVAPFKPVMLWDEDQEKRASMLDTAFDLGYAGFPTKCVADLGSLIRQARRNLSVICCPILVIQSHGDETISADSADVVITSVSSQIKELLWLDRVPHVCTISYEYERIASSIGDFLRRAL